MFLSDEELQRLTGYKRPSAQEMALKGMGITHRVNAIGKIIVSESHINNLLDGNIKIANTEKRPQPDFSIFNG